LRDQKDQVRGRKSGADTLRTERMGEKWSLEDEILLWLGLMGIFISRRGLDSFVVLEETTILEGLDSWFRASD